jgi:GDP-D-mannose dehydratase
MDHPGNHCVMAPLAIHAHVEVDQKHIRPTAVDALNGHPSKAIKELKWKAKTH